MASLSRTQLKQFIKNCKKSASFFIENCGSVEHPSMGIIPFKLFSYQRRSLLQFRKHRFNIFLKCRQSGISTLSSAYVLWFGMFFNNKKILIVSKRDQDAKDFLAKVKFSYKYLPDWMKDIWKTPTWNEHEIGFPNGSLIRSLTSSVDTLRSNAASLNIIDEAAFMPDMEGMWAGGWSTLQHGGSVIVISTPNGTGNWYWEKWTEAENEPDALFNPIKIDWWDMDWELQFTDAVSGKKTIIAPRRGIRKCKDKYEIEKYGPYWSPWLEGEYKGLQSKGESHLFKQEVLAQFLGGGGTVLSAAALINVEEMVKQAPPVMKFPEPLPYINQTTGEREYLDFNGVESNEGLWIWEEPEHGKRPKIVGSRVIEKGEPGHQYVIGVDIATGEGNDFSAIQVFDITSMAQVAEYMGRVPIETLAKMADFLGRYYNTALVNPERSGVGIPFVQDFKKLAYPNIWQQKERGRSGMKRKPHGFSTTPSSKPTLNKALCQFISEEAGEGYTIRSSRLHHQLKIYIRHRDKRGFETKKTGAQIGRGNYDDLVIAAAMAFVAAPDAIDINPWSMLPAKSAQALTPIPTMDAQPLTVADRVDMQQQAIGHHTDPGLLLPLSNSQMDMAAMSPDMEAKAFASQIITNASKSVPATTSKKHRIIRPR